MDQVRKGVLLRHFWKTPADNTDFGGWNEEDFWEIIQACHRCRDMVEKKLSPRGIKKFDLPERQPSQRPYVPVYATVENVMSTKDHVMIILPSLLSLCGVWTPEKISNDSYSIEEASAISLVDYLYKNYGNNAPGLIILNPGELIWVDDGENFDRSLHPNEYIAYQRIIKQSSGQPMGPENYIKDHETLEEHFRSTLRKFLTGIPVADGGGYIPPIVRADARLSLITVECEMNNWIVKEYEDPNDNIPDLSLKERLRAVAWMGKAPIINNRSQQTRNFFQNSSKAWVAVEEGTERPARNPQEVETKLVYPLHQNRRPRNIMAEAFPEAVDFIMNKLGIQKIDRAEASDSRS